MLLTSPLLLAGPLQEELESFPLESILRCTAVLDSCTYDSVLAITMQDRNRQGISILLFQCTQSGVSCMGTATLCHLWGRATAKGTPGGLRDLLGWG